MYGFVVISSVHCGPPMWPPTSTSNIIETGQHTEIPKVSAIPASDLLVHHSSDVRALLYGFVANNGIFRNMSVTLLPTSDWLRAGQLSAFFFQASKCKLFFGGGTEATLATQWITAQGRQLDDEALQWKNINKLPQAPRYEDWQAWLLKAVRMYLFPHAAEGDVDQETGAHFGVDLLLFLQEMTATAANGDALQNEAQFLLDEIVERKLNQACGAADLLLLKDESLLRKAQETGSLADEELISERRHFLEKIWALRTSDDSLEMGVCEFVVECPASALLGVQVAPKDLPHKQDGEKGTVKALFAEMHDKLNSEAMNPVPFVEGFGEQLEEGGHSWKIVGFQPTEDVP